MLDDKNFVAPPGQEWQTQVKYGLDGRFNAIAEAIFRDTSARQLRFDLVKKGRTALTLRVTHEDRSVILKLFHATTPHAQSVYLRERNSLIAFSHTGLVPPIIGFEDKARFVVTEAVEGPTLTDAGNGLSPEEAGARLGWWIARMNAVAPARSASGNWLSHLAKFGDQLGLKEVGPAREILARVPLCGLSLSRGDAALHNYIVSRDGGLIGLDFEGARLRPHGWDYMMAHHALMQRFGKYCDGPLRAFRDSFHKHHRGALITDELNDVAQVLYCARALARQPQGMEVRHGN